MSPVKFYLKSILNITTNHYQLTINNSRLIDFKELFYLQN